MGRARKFTNKDKWCSGCKKQLPLEAFAVNRSTVSGRQDYCYHCHNGLKWSKDANKTGYVYVIGNPESGLYKIGCSTNLEARLRKMQAHSPVRLTLVASKKVERMLGSERAAHFKVAEFSEQGGWFRLTYDEAVHALDALVS